MSTFFTRITETDPKKHKATSKDMIKLTVFILIFICMCIIYAMRDIEKINILKKDFTSIEFLSIFIIIIFFIIIGFILKGRIKIAVIYGTISFITAYLGHLNMSFAVFFIVSLFAFYMHKNEKLI